MDEQFVRCDETVNSITYQNMKKMDLTKVGGSKWNSKLAYGAKFKLILPTQQTINDFKKDTVELRSSHEAIDILNTKRSKGKRQFITEGNN
jgi:hypothetical protein